MVDNIILIFFIVVFIIIIILVHLLRWEKGGNKFSAIASEQSGSALDEVVGEDAAAVAERELVVFGLQLAYARLGDVVRPVAVIGTFG